MFRIGIGTDIHELAPGGRLMLAGVEVPSELGTIAHSDGDVVLHALTDALLGALALGDIGQHFPDSDPRWKDSPSEVFVREAMRLAGGQGFSIGNVDVVIHLEKPRLSAWVPAMRERLSILCSCEVGQVSVKAKTAEGMGSVGNSQAVSAQAIVLLAQ